MLQTTAEENKRDGGATNTSTLEKTKQDATEKGSYRSQKQVDEAFKKRLSAMREKWESEQKEKQKTDGNEKQVKALMQNIENGAKDFFNTYPDVDISTLLSEDALFAYLVASGKSLTETYAFLYDKNAKQKLQTQLEQEILGNMRARNQRPRALKAANSGATSKDIARLSDAEILRIDSRIKSGERVTL